MTRAKESPERRRVREAAERARWLFEYENPRPAAERAAERDWHPTEAECRFMSKDERDRCWRSAIQSAARAGFPKQPVMLRRAAYLGGVLTVARRLSEDRALEHLHRAARAAKVGNEEAERVIGDGYHLGRANAFKELARDGAIEGHPPGAFSAIASAENRYDHEIDMFVDPGALTPLPVATLVYLDHSFEPAPVAVAVPRMRGGLVEVDAVFSSAAGAAWTLTRTRRLRSVSIFAHCQEFYRGIDGRLVKGVLTSVDLCEVGKDDRAKVTAVVAAADLTPAQREVQRRFDQYLADGSPVAYDFIARADRDGPQALEPLRPVVAPLIGTWSEPEPARRASSSTATRVVTRSVQSRCGVTFRGFSCDNPRGHHGMHFSDRPPAGSESTCMAWDDRSMNSGGLGSKRLGVVA